jgi:hypothetical protein
MRPVLPRPRRGYTDVMAERHAAPEPEPIRESFLRRAVGLMLLDDDNSIEVANPAARRWLDLDHRDVAAGLLAEQQDGTDALVRLLHGRGMVDSASRPAAIRRRRAGRARSGCRRGPPTGSAGRRGR